MIFEIVVIACVLVLTNQRIYIYKKNNTTRNQIYSHCHLKKKVENPVENPDGIIICVSVSVFQ